MKSLKTGENRAKQVEKLEFLKVKIEKTAQNSQKQAINGRKVGIFESGISENSQKQGKTGGKVGVFESKGHFCMKTAPRACGFKYAHARE